MELPPEGRWPAWRSELGWFPGTTLGTNNCLGAPAAYQTVHCAHHSALSAVC